MKCHENFKPNVGRIKKKFKVPNFNQNYRLIETQKVNSEILDQLLFVLKENRIEGLEPWEWIDRSHQKIGRKRFDQIITIEL